MTLDWNRYLDYEQTIFKWHEFLDKNQPGYNRPTPWHNSSTWWPWFFDRMFPQGERGTITE